MAGLFIFLLLLFLSFVITVLLTIIVIKKNEEKTIESECLDNWGALFAIKRNCCESNENYRERISKSFEER